MRLERQVRRLALGMILFGFACGGGGGGGTGPCTPGAATQLVKTSGDPAPWYFNNPLPAALSVTARDANNCVVPGVVVNWAAASGGGSVRPAQTTTNANGVATATDSVGSSTPQSVTATPAITSLPTVTFSVTASAPPPTGAVTVGNNFFSPDKVPVQVGGAVTWTWNPGGTHTITFTGGPSPLPAEAQQASGTHAVTFTKVGTYSYHCTIHAGMDGTVTVVH
jgi:plastocyanin